MAHISLIAGMGKNRVIGYQNQLPWHLPADMKWFKQNTLGKPIVMGRKTWESLRKPLPGRRNIVVTHQKAYQAPGCEVASSLEHAIEIASSAEEIVVMGGAELYRQALPQAHKLYLTFIDHTFTGDAYFPKWNRADWRVVFEEFHKADENNLYPYRFVIYHNSYQSHLISSQ